MNKYSEIQNLRITLSSLMKKYGLTQQEIYERTGVTQSAISLFINGRRGLSGDSALRIVTFIDNFKKCSIENKKN